MTHSQNYLFSAVISFSFVFFIGCDSPAGNNAKETKSPAATVSSEVAIPVASEDPNVPSPKPEPTPGPAPIGMVWIPGGTFQMGAVQREKGQYNFTDMRDMADSQPVHPVKLEGFWMDETEVTNAQFTEFVKSTGYVTVAEIAPKAEDYPGAPPENLVPGSVVFYPPEGPVDLTASSYQWWAYIPGANWKHPEGPESSLDGRLEHPVVHVAWHDAMAYAAWAQKRLPTEAEWELAARGGLHQKPYVWGDDFRPNQKYMANTFQGRFPYKNTVEDGFASTSPVKSFEPNAYGLYDVAGNVWEWCSDWYRPDYFQVVAKNGLVENPQGPSDSFDPAEPFQKKRVMKGGSYLCTDQFCTRYMPGGRGKGDPVTGTNHLGFRLVRSAK